MNGLREVCKCGHDITTHFKEADGTRGACTGLGCNVTSKTCTAYRNENEPDEPAPETLRVPDFRHQRRPHADPSCSCTSCRRWARGF